MKVKLQFFRVYGSKFQYASNSRFITSNDPVKFKFPFENDDSVIVLGKPCKSIFEANNIKLANGMRILNSSPYENNGIKRELTLEEIDIEIEKELKELNKNPKTSECNFYVSIIIEKEVDIPEENFVNSKYFWLEYQNALDLDMEFRSYASSKADLIASIISIPISKLFFKKIVINSVFFSADSRKTFGIPVFKMDWQSNPMLNGYELENLVKFLNILKLIPKELEELLDFVIHYKMAALMEKDQMKIFIFNFLALEVLINKLFELVPERVIIDENWRDFIDSTDIHENNWKNKRNRKRYLKTKFAIVSYVLSPERALNNYNKFKEIKKIRDDLSHGKIKLDQLKLPINELDVLLNEYILYSLESYKFILNKK